MYYESHYELHYESHYDTNSGLDSKASARAVPSTAGAAVATAGAAVAAAAVLSPLLASPLLPLPIKASNSLKSVSTDLAEHGPDGCQGPIEQRVRGARREARGASAVDKRRTVDVAVRSEDRRHGTFKQHTGDEESSQRTEWQADARKVSAGPGALERH